VTDGLFTPPEITKLGKGAATYTDALNRRLIDAETKLATLLGESDGGGGSSGSVLTSLPPFAKFGLMTARASATSLTVSPGGCSSEGGGSRATITLESAITKSLTPFAEGSGGGGLTSSLLPNTWYFPTVVRKSDGTADVILDASPTGPAVPTGFEQWRRVGAFVTDGSSQITGFVQAGNRFTRDAVIQDVNISTTGLTTASSRTLSTPLGIVTGAMIYAGISVSTTGVTCHALITPLSTTDTAPSTSLYNAHGHLQAAQTVHSSFLIVDTDVLSQVRVRTDVSNANTFVRIGTLGWVDYFGEV
jgi:hypothetical protein